MRRRDDMRKENKIHSIYSVYSVGFLCCIMVILAFCRLPLPVQADSVDSVQENKDCTVERLDDAKEAAQVVLEDWEEDYYGEILVHEDSNQIEIDGEKDTFTETFSVSTGKMKEAVSSQDDLSGFLETRSSADGKVYEVDEKEDGLYSLTSPYQSKRIVIYSTAVENSYGAEEKYIYEEGSETILCFATEEDTKAAFEQIKNDYGEKECFVDKICSLEDMATSVSWGGTATGMATLKTDVSLTPLPDKVTVAVIDTGNNLNHSMFQNRSILNRSFNFMERSFNINDNNGHGTHVAGIIADLTPANVDFLVLKIADSEGSSSSLVMNLAVNYAISEKVDVMNISYGFLSKSANRFTFLDKAINRAYKEGIPVVTAAGNLATDVAGRDVKNCYPACNSQTIAVSALDKDLKLAYYSYYGSAIDFTAPGTQIASAWIGTATGVKVESGTSMAAPHITAALAYIKLRDKDLSVQGACLELMRYCKDLGEQGRDEKYGYGYPDLSCFLTSQSNYDSWTVSNMLRSPEITVCRNGDKGTEMKWTPVPGALGYEVYRRKNGGGISKIATVSTPQYLDRGLKEGEYSSYNVVAYTLKNGIRSISGNSNTVGNITLKKNKIVKLRPLGRRKVMLRLKKLPSWEDKFIQIQVSNRKDFRQKKTRTIYAFRNNCRIKSKKKGFVYIRLRSKFRWEGKTYHSAWSNIKKVKVR